MLLHHFRFDAARSEYPEHTIILKTHPDVLTNGKMGYFDLAAVATNEPIEITCDPIHPSRLIEHADAVYTVTSQMGFEALIWGKRVRCFGMPFYAGWGLTEDELPAPERRRPVTLEQLVHASLVKYPRYVDPVTMKRCEPERSFAHVGLQRRKRKEFPQHIIAIGFSRWKRPFIQRFLQGSDVVFAKAPPAISPSQSSPAIAVWGSADAPALPENATILRIEDGFLRSSGLGADLVRPQSLVIDDVGIYYDATRPSRLEHILVTQVLDDAAVQRADELRDRIIELDLTKYNLGHEAWDRPNGLSHVILVVGQVETDASIRLGSPEVSSNVELLRRVREENPSAYIVYKPHPDVLAGLRRQGDGEGAALAFADEVLARPVSLGQLLGQVDEVHTMTSLLGFEALIRGVKVVCHGLPFYAGWGLTEDRMSCPRRTRRLASDATVEEFLNYWNRRIHTQFDSTSGIIEIEVQSFNEEHAREIADAVLTLTQALINDLSANARSDVLRFAREEVELQEVHLRNALGAIRDFRASEQSVDPSASAALEIQLIANLESRLIDLNARIAALRQTLARALLVAATYTLIMAIFYSALIALGLASLPHRPEHVILAFLATWLLGLGFGTLNAVIASLWDTWTQIEKILTRPLFFVSGIFYVPSQLPPHAREILQWNPVLHLVEWFRHGFYPNYNSMILDMWYPVGVGAAMLLLGLVGERLFRRERY